MAEYTREQHHALRARWGGHENEVQTLVGIIRSRPDWAESAQYEALALLPIPNGVDVTDRDLRGAPLRRADLSGAHLWGASMCAGDLRGANLSQAHLLQADLSGSFLEEADLSGANLSHSNLSGANLWSADLSSAILDCANVSGADLLMADLSGAFVGPADLSGASLVGLNLRGANLRHADLSDVTSLLGAEWNARSKLWPRIRRLDFRARKLKASERKTQFGNNDLRNANWAGAALLKRYVEDENFLQEFRERHKVWAFLWRWSCDYGRSMLRWAVCAAVLAVIFAAIYWSFGCGSIAFNAVKLSGTNPGFRAYLYYSVVTFTTLWFGDIVPLTNWARLAVAAEVIFGYVMLGGLISIFANKLARRA